MSFWKRPSFWTTLVTLIVYGSDSLTGTFVYDDAGSVSRNVIVTGLVPLEEIWKRDFWGTSLAEPGSHKSFRPITTLTFYWNWQYSKDNNNKVDSTFGFHLVNVLLHGMVVWLVTEVSGYVFLHNHFQGNVILAQTWTGLLFGLHPLHVEAVSNITSRGEMLMSIFMLVAFLVYAPHVMNENETTTREESIPKRIQSILCIYILPWLCMALSMFSKEQGATTLMSCVAFDFIHNFHSLQGFFKSCNTQRQLCIKFVRRTVILALETLVLCVFRMTLNGETLPDFIQDQNPAAFASDRFTRIFSTNWIYCLYTWDYLVPTHLCCDWSGNSIPLITTYEVRIVGVLMLWGFVLWCCYHLVISSHNYWKRIVTMAFFAFWVFPFLLSSNLLVVVGLMKADRVVYLPLLGTCLLEALVYQVLFCNNESKTTRDAQEENATFNNTSVSAATTKQDNIKITTSPVNKHNKIGCSGIGYLFVLLRLIWFSRIVHERNVAWTSNLNLWMSAYQVNPTSYHTMYNCGYELSLKQRHAEAETVMRPIGSARVNGPSNTFVYAMTLYNLNRKQDARDIVEEALEVIQEQRQEYNANTHTQFHKRHRPELLARTESNLMVAKALTMDDIRQAGEWMYKAVATDPRNEYAIQQAQLAVTKMQELNLL